MNKNWVPNPQDEALRMEAVITKTANFNGTGFDHGVGFAPGGLGMPFAAVLDISACDRTSGDETYTFVLQDSADNATFTDCGPAVAVTVGTLATLGAISVPGWVSNRYSRLKLTVAGTTPSITYQAWINPNVR